MNKNAAPSPDWFGVAFIGICATAGTIATSSIALCIQQAILYADTHLDGGMAFAAFAFTNFFFVFACLASAMALSAYIVVFILSLKSTVSPHVKVASLFLIPCVFTLGLLVKRLLGAAS